MTTILGIKTNSGEGGIILAADTKINVYEDEDVIGKEKACKIRVGNNYAIAFAGTVDAYLESFFNYLSRRKNYQEFVSFISDGKNNSAPKLLKKDPFVKIIEEEYLEALNVFNRYQSKRNDGSVDDTIDLIIASNKPSLQLYNIDAFGNLLKTTRPGGFHCVYGGSGSKIVKDYLSEEEYKNDPDLKQLKISADDVTIPLALKLATKAMKKASKDSDTGDIVDLVVVKKYKIDNYCSEVLKSVDLFYDRVISNYD